ncbi:hypothetical protein [Amycolatopsis plumensis]|uniref:Uncharacterized protein n=1 Tax=Amycolatopsis plumensis TaxID=236508 RepID=A0ABV5TY53_9PSEU
MRQLRTGVVDGGVGVAGGAVRDGEGGGDEEGAGVVADEDGGTGAGSDAGAAAAPSTGVPPHPASTGKEIANNTASVLRRIFPPAAAIPAECGEP